jgi:hypothetical protein
MNNLPSTVEQRDQPPPEPPSSDIADIGEAVDDFLNETIEDTQLQTFDAPGITIFGHDFDEATAIVNVFALLLLLALPIACEALRSLPYLIVALTYSAYLVFDTLISSPTVNNINQAQVELSRRSQHTLAMFGPLIVLLVGSRFLPVEYDPKNISILVTAVLLFVLANVFYDISSTSLSYKAIYLYKKMLLNIAILLVIIFICSFRIKQTN